MKKICLCLLNKCKDLVFFYRGFIWLLSRVVHHFKVRPLWLYFQELYKLLSYVVCLSSSILFIPARAATVKPHSEFHQYLSTAAFCSAAPDRINLPCHHFPSGSSIQAYSTLVLSQRNVSQSSRRMRHSCVSQLVISHHITKRRLSHSWRSPSEPLSVDMEDPVSPELRVCSTVPTPQWMAHWLFRTSSWAAVNWYSGISIQRFDQAGDYPPMIGPILWKQSGRHDLQTTTNRLKFKVQKPFPKYWVKQSCFCGWEPAAN